MGHRVQCGTGGIGYGGMGYMGNGVTGGNGVQAHLDLLGIGQNVFKMTRKEGTCDTARKNWNHLMLQAIFKKKS